MGIGLSAADDASELRAQVRRFYDLVRGEQVREASRYRRDLLCTPQCGVGLLPESFLQQSKKVLKVKARAGSTGDYGGRRRSRLSRTGAPIHGARAANPPIRS